MVWPIELRTENIKFQTRAKGHVLRWFSWPGLANYCHMNNYRLPVVGLRLLSVQVQLFGDTLRSLHYYVRPLNKVLASEIPGLIRRCVNRVPLLDIGCDSNCHKCCVAYMHNESPLCDRKKGGLGVTILTMNYCFSICNASSPAKLDARFAPLQEESSWH